MMRMLRAISRSHGLPEHVHWRACSELKDKTRWQRQLSHHITHASVDVDCVFDKVPGLLEYHGARVMHGSKSGTYTAGTTILGS